jgi:hypothetical protein
VDLSFALFLFVGGLAGGVINTLAGGGSLITVPLLVLAGIPGTLANGTNRVGVLLQNVVAARHFRRHGLAESRQATGVLAPVVTGSLVGAYGASLLPDRAFEQAFGIAMVALLVPVLFRPTPPVRNRVQPPWPAWVSVPVFFLIGLYGGGLQAGVGVFLVFALAYAGYDLVTANAIKVVVVGVLTAVALPVFIWQGQVVWLPAAVLAAGFALGGGLGARLAVAGGEAVLKPVLALAVLALAGRMIGLY